MRQSTHGARNAHTEAISLADVHDLRLTALLFDLEDQTRRRRRRLAVVREEIRRAELKRWMRRVFTLGLWRG